MVDYRPLSRPELPAIWTIDRTELVEEMYVVIDGALELRPCHFDLHGWPEGEPEQYAPRQRASFDAGAWFMGAWDGDALAGVAILESGFIGPGRDTLQLGFLHVSRGHRGNGVGVSLFEQAREEAGRRGAARMYISATASRNTVRFYLARGCWLNPTPDPRLFALESADIHLLADCRAPSQRFP